MLAFRILYGLILPLLLVGCVTRREAAPARPFLFYHDSFSFSNQLVWEYQFDHDTGKTTTVKREPPPTYTHHCFVVARAARQFLHHAQFAPDVAAVADSEYRTMVREVVSRSPQRISRPEDKIMIPGYADLREFSAAKEGLLKAECGGAWQSYFQCGHWRMVFPFTRGSQERAARALLEKVQANDAPIVHLVRFPRLTINHAVVIFEAAESADEIQFSTYDPNNRHVPELLVFNKGTRRFQFPRTSYFIGGRVDVYEIFRGWCY